MPGSCRKLSGHCSNRRAVQPVIQQVFPLGPLVEAIGAEANETLAGGVSVSEDADEVVDDVAPVVGAKDT